MQLGRSRLEQLVRRDDDSDDVRILFDADSGQLKLPGQLGKIGDIAGGETGFEDDHIMLQDAAKGVQRLLIRPLGEQASNESRQETPSSVPLFG